MKEHYDLLHALQTGVATIISLSQDLGDRAESSPKHLRVGVSNSLIEISALAQILMEKGIMTYEEYVDKKIEILKREVEDYEARLYQDFGYNVTLH
jgi:hypothetical protein